MQEVCISHSWIPPHLCSSNRQWAAVSHLTLCVWCWLCSQWHVPAQLEKKKKEKKTIDPKGMISWIISLQPFPSRTGNPVCVQSSWTGNKLLTLWLLLAGILQTSAFGLKARPLRCIKACTLALIVELPFRTKRLQRVAKALLSVVHVPVIH